MNKLLWAKDLRPWLSEVVVERNSGSSVCSKQLYKDDNHDRNGAHVGIIQHWGDGGGTTLPII
jgi:hypothetical protein